ncbi:MBOAT family protein [Mediterraneibacter glycyrrhizinilyticus]|uniref:MBOAT family O-acyltransferase n=1 Tax=Mediterraneibacter glycyrrhizinilyticus TaxID=342942 RepID=UPI001961F590|nr:MBOAT family protein [Mediterraneibacter glycyrrhizinilyticus]MBM6751422.1 MBOAT family protein [Mediterraneibacter glycyrrhizinilyticus]
MVFSSITFLFLFLPVVLAVYYIAPEKYKNIILLISSIIFYAWGEPVYVVLMILSILLNYFCGLDIGSKAEDPVRAKRSVIFAVVVNILILGFFKYYGFLLDMLNSILPGEIPYRELSLPIGISFYTFQSLSYIIDVYRKKVKPQNSLLLYAVYISMFPQLIAGPIVRYIDIEEQLTNRKTSAVRLGRGAALFIRGLAKKAVIANMTGEIFQQISDMQASQMTVLMAWLGCISYAFQIYFDFSGYSDMAQGLGRMFGFEFRKNFDYPYISRSITEFWRRWHISLSTWFREYVYIPLGGNRCSAARNMANLMIVWTLTGMWHGAAWNFIVWGVYYGVLLVMEKYVWGASVDQLPSPVRRIYSLVLILIGWVFFFSPSIGYALRYLAAMFGGGAGIADKGAWFILFSHWLLYLLAVLGSTTLGYRLIRGLTEVWNGSRARTAAVLILYFGMFFVAMAFLVTGDYNPFLYFRF